MSSPGENPTDQPAPVLNYAAPDEFGMVQVGEFSSVNMAELFAAALAAESIPARVLNGNSSASGMANAQVYVRPADATRAAAILEWSSSEDLEPAPEGGVEDPPTDAAGQPVPVAPAALFESMRLLRQGELLLASGGIESFSPRLVPRSQRPGLTGKRFVLSVRTEDLDDARRLFRRAKADREVLMPRCPKCGARKPRRMRKYWQTLTAMLGFAPRPVPEWRCVTCWHRGPWEQFAQSGD